MCTISHCSDSMEILLLGLLSCLHFLKTKEPRLSVLCAYLSNTLMRIIKVTNKQQFEFQERKVKRNNFFPF